MGYPKLTSAEFIKEFTLRLCFSDGVQADVNFEKEMAGGVFEALRDPNYFRSFSFSPQFGSIEWTNGADFAPEFLYNLAKSSGQQPARFNARPGSRKSA